MERCLAGREGARAGVAALALAWLAACGGDEDERSRVPVERIVQSPAAALLSVHGRAADDVWMVGADDGGGPLVLHAEGGRWTRLDAGLRADLWWVQALPSGSVLAAGSAAAVLTQRDGAFEPAETPGLGRDTVFGVWAASEEDVYAVGSHAGRRGFVWHFDGTQWVVLEPPEDVPRDPDGLVPGLFKVWGSGADDVWVVGDRGLVLRGSAAAGFSVVASDPDQRLFTVHGAGGRVAMVGGSGNGFALETDGAGLADVTPPGAGLLQGVRYGADGALWAVGLGGAMFVREPGASTWQQLPVTTPVQSLHAVWVDERGGAWSVGGNVLTRDLDGGVALHQGSGPAIERLELEPPPAAEAVCPAGELDPAPAASIAWRWDEQLLGAIRRDRPRPLVHTRNLFHAAVAMWDAWAAYDPMAAGVVADDSAVAPLDLEAARREAISYAAYRVLVERYAGATGGATSVACFGAFMRELGYDPDDAGLDGDSPRALGNRVARAVIEAFADDGANQAADYADPAPPEPDNPPLDVDAPGTSMRAPGRWQPLVLAEAVTASGISLGSGVQRYEGSHWGGVRPFALPAQPELGAPPAGIDAALVDAVVEVIIGSGELDPGDGVRIDTSPATQGGAALGADDGAGHPLNPVTGLAYAARPTLRGDYARALVEHWSDAIETPAGHWNRLAHELALDPRFERRLFGETILEPLAWDVHVGLALNGALHDAAVASAALARSHMSARPISLVRYLGGLGQRTDAAGPSYADAGLPLVPGSIELVDPVTSAPGERHAHLRAHVGEVALRVWPGEPGVGARRAVGARWILAKDWVPYQSRFSVSPPSPGYVALPSALARAASTVLATLTGNEYFPGGLARVRVEPGSFTLDIGPSEPVELEWATYHDAADLAGLSMRWAGTQLRADDLDGRRVGASAGAGVVERVRGIFGGVR